MGKRIPSYIGPFVSVLHKVITRLPFKLARGLMGFVMVKGGHIFLKVRNIRANIREVYPDINDEAVENITKKMLQSFGYLLTEVFHMRSFKDGKGGLRIDYSTPKGVEFDGTGPAVYVGAHVGSWEMLPLVFAQKGQPITIIYSQNEHDLLEKMLMPKRLLTGGAYVEKRKALRPCYDALSRGESIALLVDQRVDPGIDVSFFDRPTAISRLPAKLATNFDCPIIPMEVVRVEASHLRVNFQEAILPNGKRGKQAELELTQKIAAAIEQSIRRNFEAWFCTKLRWKRIDREKIQTLKLASES